MTKRIAQRLRFYVLEERLKYKSPVHKRGCREINVLSVTQKWIEM
jgi:hypothetical protein